MGSVGLRPASFTLRDIRRTLAVAAPGAGREGAVYAGLERLTEQTLGHEWRRDDGAQVRIDRCLTLDAPHRPKAELASQAWPR